MKLPDSLTSRKLDSHKGQFGHIFILAGSLGMTGAAVLASRAAMRSGAGLVTVGLPESVNSIVAGFGPEIMTLPLPQTSEGSLSEMADKRIKEFLEKADVFLVGPGLSQHIQTQRMIRRAICESRIKTLIDADGINCWIGNLDKFKVEVSCLPLEEDHLRIITPHPKELARLLDVEIKELQKDRLGFAAEFAKEYNVICVLKGFNSIVVGPKGENYINKTGNSGMSTAGSGDVLAGIISAFLAQGLNSFDAAKYGVYIHGLAGDLAVKDKTQLGLIASDIINYLPKALKMNS